MRGNRDDHENVGTLTNVDVGEPDEVGCVGVEEDVVVARLVAEEVLHLQPRVAPVQPQRRLQRDQLQGRKGVGLHMTSGLWTTPTLLLHLNHCILYRVPLAVYYLYSKCLHLAVMINSLIILPLLRKRPRPLNWTAPTPPSPPLASSLPA